MSGADASGRRGRPSGRRVAGLPTAPDVDVTLLGEDVRAELRGLTAENADRVGRHLVAAGQLIDDDPARALSHAQAARATAGRVGAVREAVGLTAYAAGQWQEALSELRAAQRITGAVVHLPLMADSERGLGRPQRAVELARSPEAARLGPAELAELRIVEAGARRDLGQIDAALLVLQDAGVRDCQGQQWAVRLWYAYADALLAAGRPAEARDWFGRAAGADQYGLTDADARLAELDNPT
ncbi:tetratricopeptide repeat protein [soil metagenome]